MTSRTAETVTAAAQALQAWLDSQPLPARRSAAAPPGPSAATMPDPSLDPAATTAFAAASSLAAGAGRKDIEAAMAAAAPLRLAHTDWLYHRLTVAGPAAAMEHFARASAGAGVIPWALDCVRLTEDLFHALVAPPPPQRRSLSLSGARILAEQLGQAVTHRQTLANARVGVSRACPFDLHALLPVPADLLSQGPDDPAALAWLWTHWGTTTALRQVRMAGGFADEVNPEPAAFRVSFFSADWTPWRAVAALGTEWPALRFSLRPVYDG